ncbi:MAG: AcrB/AcrD/AcrF family protein, partial [Deltaproteobacteria bacterium]
SGITLNRIIDLISGINRDIPLGFTKSKEEYYSITYYGERDSVSELKDLTISPNVKLGNIATIRWEYKKRFSAYLGNGRPAIAISVQRAPGGSVLATSKAARKIIKGLKERYKNIRFKLTDTQRIVIDTANRNMLDALRDAIIFTLIVILIFLGNFKAMLAALVSIPMVFFSTMAITWMMGGELNIVIYTAIILALGMLVDDAVVVLENIERHLSSLKEDLNTAVVQGTKEVIAPVFAGTIATISIMFPLLFVGDFPQKIFRPLVETLIIALIASYFLSITFIPSFSAYLYRKGVKKSRIELWLESLYQRSFGRLVTPYVSILEYSQGKRAVLRKTGITLAVVLLFLVSLRGIMPVIGRDLMPPMDTGIIMAHVRFSTNETVDEVLKRIRPFTKWLHSQKEVVMSSIAFGSEPGVLSLGKGSLPTEATMSINCVDRFKRKKTIWQLENEIRDHLVRLRNTKAVDVYDFGATAMSSIKAPIDVRLMAEDYNILPGVANDVARHLEKVKGLKSINTSWDKDLTEVRIDIYPNRALEYGLTPAQVAYQLPLKGYPVTLSSNLVSMQTQFVRLYFTYPYAESVDSLRLIPIQTPKGPVPLTALASIHYGLTSAKVERDNMLYSIDVNAYRARRPVSIFTSDTNHILKKEVDTSGVVLSQEGDIKQMKDSFTRMIKGTGIGVVLLLMALIAIYRSVRMAIVMILVLPLSMIGAAWAMLIFHKPSCMPSLVGIMLLFGIIIKNSVLLIDFYQEFRKEAGPFEAAKESVRIRFRPVFMTAFGTIAGMIPIALEWAVGLERLSPLADVAIGGLLIGTILTLIYVPMFAYSVDTEDT